MGKRERKEKGFIVSAIGRPAVDKAEILWK